MKNYKDLLINIIYLFVINIIFELLIFKDISILSLLFYLLSAITVGIIIKLLSSILKNNKINKTINIILLTIISVIYLGQFVHYHFYSCFFSFYSLLHSGQVFAFTEAIIKIILENIWGFLLLFIFIPVVLIFIIKTNYISNKKKNIKEGLVLLLSIGLFITFGTLITSGTYSYHNLLYNTNDQILNTKKMGLLPAEFIDIERYFIKFNPNTKSISSKAVYTFKSDNDIEYNVTDIDFSKLIKNEKNEKVKSIHKYFSDVKPSDKNEYTGIFEGKNLIFITAESLDFSIIDKDLTPTLYKLYNEGIIFNNFYTPIYYASTSDGEYANLTGLVPKSGTWSYISSINNYYPYSFPNVFKNLGYDSSYYHNGVYDFYNRNTVSKNLGYKVFKGCGDGLEKKINCKLWPQSDSEMFKTTFSEYKDSHRFVTYYMTISTHLSHNFNDNDMANKWKDKVSNSKYSEHVKAYQSSAVELDYALKGLLSDLKSKNLLESTVIVITPDHFPYGLNRSEIKEFKDINNEYDLYKSNLIIYNSVTKPTKINKYAGSIDITPTILNMFGVNYDSRLMIGQDIMSNKDGIVIFNDRSFLTNKGYYNQKTDKFSSKISSNYIKEKQNEVYNKVNISGKVLDTNYYKYINKEREN